jgi:hypothetical protein
MHGELDSVIALGRRAVPLLEAALKEGPPPDRRTHMRRQAEGMYGHMRDTSIVSLTRYVDHYAENYVAGYQSQAALALERIGTQETREILLDALRDDANLPASVQSTLGSSLGVTLSLIVGDSQHAPVDSFVKINPMVRVRDSASGSGLEGVRVLFFVDSGSGTIVDSVERTDSAGRALVRWRLGPDPNDSLNLLRIVAVGRAVRVRAKGHAAGLRLVFLTQPSGGKAGQPIVPPVRVAVQDAWGATATSVKQPLTLTVLGAGISSMHNLVAGVVHLPSLNIPDPGTGLRLGVKTAGAAPAESDSFDIMP